MDRKATARTTTSFSHAACRAKRKNVEGGSTALAIVAQTHREFLNGSTKKQARDLDESVPSTFLSLHYRPCVRQPIEALGMVGQQSSHTMKEKESNCKRPGTNKKQATTNTKKQQKPKKVVSKQLGEIRVKQRFFFWTMLRASLQLWQSLSCAKIVIVRQRDQKERSGIKKNKQTKPKQAPKQKPNTKHPTRP